MSNKAAIPVDTGLRLEFEVIGGNHGVFRYGPSYQALAQELFAILDAGLPDQDYLRALRRLVRKAPDFVDGHAHIALYWHDHAQPRKALAAALTALSIANSRIPEGFSGRIEWARLDNRPYLRAMHVALGAYIATRQHRHALTLIELMLARNPDDNQGVRFLLGSQTLRAGDLKRAQELLAAGLGDGAPNWYELALCHLLRNNVVAAATMLRKGFVTNPYIAEMLGGHPDPAPVAIEHGLACGELWVAHDYVSTHGALWQSKPDFRAMVRWLFNQPGVLAERAIVMACKEALARETDVDARSAMITQLDEHIHAINDTLSNAILIKREYRLGRPVWPWQFKHSR